MKKHLLIILAAVMIVGCEPSNISDDKFTSVQLPSNAKDVNLLGNNWITFNLEVEGRRRTFMYHGASLNGDGARECITELNP